MVTILPRTAWHPEPTRTFSRALNPAQVTGIVSHWPGDGAPSRTGLSQERVAALLRGYRRHHRVNRGWPDIGYCYAVDQAGRIWTLAGNRVAAHSATKADPLANQTNIGVLWVIGNESPTPAAIQAFRELRAHLLRTFPHATRLRGHQQVTGASTACPGSGVLRLITSGTLTSTTTAPPPPAEDDEMTPEQDALLTQTRTLVGNIYEAVFNGSKNKGQRYDAMVDTLRTTAAGVDYAQDQLRSVARLVVEGRDTQGFAAAVADALRDDLTAAVAQAAPGADAAAILDALHKRLEN